MTIKLALDKPMKLLLTPIDGAGYDRTGTDPEFFSDNLDVMRVTPLAENGGFAVHLQPFGIGTCHLNVGCEGSGGSVVKSYDVHVVSADPTDFREELLADPV